MPAAPGASPTPRPRLHSEARAGDPRAWPATERATARGGPASSRRQRRRDLVSGRSRRRILVRRLIAFALATVFLGSVASYAAAVLRPSSVGIGVRSVEWLRDHGMAWLVSDVESLWYSLNAPATGGPGLHALPQVGRPAPTRGAGPGHWPTAIAPVLSPALPGEGRWRGAGPPAGGSPPILVTSFRPDANYPRMVAGVAWIDRSRTRVSLYPGRYEPPTATFRGPVQVPTAARSQLVATFNSGFKLTDSSGGFAALGHLDVPLRPGLATLVGSRDGAVDVRSWNGPPAGGPGLLFARQNLHLIVDAGRLNPSLSDGPAWGATLGNAVRVWRSGIGIDGAGNLIYAAANHQTVSSLARVLQRAGAVRAMELDINYQWVSFNAYAGAGANGAAKLLPGMDSTARRYLSPDDRDFFAVYSRG